MKRRRSVTFVLPMFLRVPIGGYLVVYEYANYLARRGYDVNLVFPREVETLQGNRASLKRRLWPLRARALFHPLIPVINFHQGVRLHLVSQWSNAAVPDADAIFATGQETALPVAALPDNKGRKFYLVQHFETWSATPEEVGATFRLPFTIVVISKWLERIVRDYGAANVMHVPNGLDHALFRETGVPRGRRTIATLYHKQPFKGVPDALDVLARLRDETPDLQVIMFGVPERGREIPAWIDYAQRPSRDALVDIYNRSSIYVSASLAEGWALPPAEAMSCGALFVGTDSGGCRDFAEPDVTALLSPPQDRDALLHNLRRALAGSPEIDEIRRRGTEQIRRFSWDLSGGKLEAIIASA